MCKIFKNTCINQTVSANLIWFGSTPHPVTVTNEGLVGDSLLKMSHHPGGDWIPRRQIRTLQRTSAAQAEPPKKSEMGVYICMYLLSVYLFFLRNMNMNNISQYLCRFIFNFSIFIFTCCFFTSPVTFQTHLCKVSTSEGQVPEMTSMPELLRCEVSKSVVGWLIGLLVVAVVLVESVKFYRFDPVRCLSVLPAPVGRLFKQNMPPDRLEVLEDSNRAVARR